MKMRRVFLLLGFVLIMMFDLEAMPLAVMQVGQTESCCFNFFPGKIPSNKILKVTKTGSHCTQQGFIVTTPLNLQKPLVVNGLHSRSVVIHSYTCKAENMTSLVNLILGFTLISALYSNAQPFSLHAVPCCFRFFKGKIPPERILKVEKTNSHCTMHGFM
ncbi:hypothetical protein HF521_018947 [Silurus meridionalis]|uniref:Chemokine interleukin-8-like domain-containing protein n=1 Tax=Silurus meridionalis TaxID=175797 RepID=A0A8T0BKU2_SILME|nr:hypothetical protein HF521_018947 [Silurus meridionalis]